MFAKYEVLQSMVMLLKLTYQPTKVKEQKAERELTSHLEGSQQHTK